MNRRYLFKVTLAVVLVALGFGLGYLYRDGVLRFKDTSDRLNRTIVFNSDGFGQVSDNNFMGNVIEINDKSMLLKVGSAEQTLRGGYQEIERKVVLASDLEIYQIVPKTEEEILGIETVEKIKKLSEEFSTPKNKNRKSIEAISQKINELEMEAYEVRSRELSDLSNQVITTPDPAQREELMKQIRALSSDKKLIKIELQDLKVGQVLRLYSATPIDFNKEVVVNRIEIDAVEATK